MEYANELKKTSFEIPDKFTVRKQLEFFSATGDSSQPLFIRHWLGALTVITNWKSEKIPDLDKLDIDNATDPDITDIVIWVGVTVVIHMNKLQDVPKN